MPRKELRPQLYYQEAELSGGINHTDRLRIIYPDGNVEWFPLHKDLHYGEFIERNTFMECCWAYDVGESPKSQMQAIRRMHAFDKEHSYPRAEFLGEL